MIKPLKNRQVCFFYIALLPVVKFFTVPSLIAGISGEDLWLSVLINSVADVVTVAVVYFSLKGEEGDFFTVIERYFGKGFSKLVACFYLLFFLFKTILPMNEVKDYVELTLYMTSPSLLTFMPVFLAVIYLASLKMRVIGRISDGIIVVALIGYGLTFALSVPQTDPLAILPVGAHGFKNICLGAYSSYGWFGDGAYFLFFTGEYVKAKKDGLKIILSAFAASLIVLTLSIIFYGTFTSIAFRQQFALTELSKYTTAINNMERFDYIPIFALLFVSIFSLSLPFFFATELLTRIFPVKRLPATVIAILPSAVLLLFFSEYYASIEYFILNFASAYIIFFGILFPITVSVIIKIHAVKEEKNAIYQG